VTHHDLHEDDRDVRDAIHALTPDVDMVFDRIETRAAGIRRRVHRRIGASVVAVVLVGVGVAFALPGRTRVHRLISNSLGDRTTAPTTRQLRRRPSVRPRPRTCRIRPIPVPGPHRRTR
jgi:hypothetical protein